MHKYFFDFSKLILSILYIFVKALDHSCRSLPNAFRAVSPANSACNLCPAGPAITKKGNLHNPPGKKIIHTLDHFLTYIPGQLSKNSNRHRTPAFSVFNAKRHFSVKRYPPYSRHYLQKPPVLLLSSSWTAQTPAASHHQAQPSRIQGRNSRSMGQRFPPAGAAGMAQHSAHCSRRLWVVLLLPLMGQWTASPSMQQQKPLGVPSG